MKRIRGIKAKVEPKTAPAQYPVAKERKTKREISPEATKKDQKEAKKAPWRMASSKSKLPVGLASNRSQSRPTFGRETSGALNSSMVQKKGDHDQSRNGTAKVKAWDMGRPLC